MRGGYAAQWAPVPGVRPGTRGIQPHPRYLAVMQRQFDTVLGEDVTVAAPTLCEGAEIQGAIKFPLRPPQGS